MSYIALGWVADEHESSVNWTGCITDQGCPSGLVCKKIFDGTIPPHGQYIGGECVTPQETVQCEVIGEDPGTYDKNCETGYRCGEDGYCELDFEETGYQLPGSDSYQQPQQTQPAEQKPLIKIVSITQPLEVATSQKQFFPVMTKLEPATASSQVATSPLMSTLAPNQTAKDSGLLAEEKEDFPWLYVGLGAGVLGLAFLAYKAV